MKRALRHLLVHLTLLIGLVAGAGLAAAPAGAAEHAPTTDRYVFAPGKVGKAVAGMSKRSALRTGLFRSNFDDGLCPVHPLAWKGAKRRGQLFVETTRSGRIVEMSALRGHYRTTRGVGIGSTYDAVKAAYGARLRAPRATANGVIAVDVRTRSGARTRWLTFGFADNEGPTLVGTSPVLNLTVKRGSKPQLVTDGC
ncbi:hypothetical protein [Solicola sp. PLA-1-18]|uniref:hypothetical protein n=1 Tax=Solicola sp. PLA-1-18 TaxID=3380532 RepID=UPI003B8144ED